MNVRENERSIIKLLVIAAALLLVVMNFGTVWAALGVLWNILFPIVLGGVFAFILNIPMKFLERRLSPKATSKRARKLRRLLSFCLSLVFIVAIFVGVVALVVPSLADALTIIVKELSELFQNVRTWAMNNTDYLSALFAQLPDLSNANTENTTQRVMQFLGQGALGLLNATVDLIATIAGGVVNVVFAFIFAIYLLFGKDTLARQLRRAGLRYAGEPFVRKAEHVLTTAQVKFESFISGQCIEAVILGMLCTLGMLVLQIPYAPMVGAVVGVTALVPIVGAYIGGAFGAFMVFSVNPVQALVFLVFLVILQQIEGNVIYQHTVGGAINLPGLWVTAAVTIGAGLAGIPGMLIGVPLAATCYDLLKEDVHRGLDGSGKDTASEGENSSQAAQ